MARLRPSYPSVEKNGVSIGSVKLLIEEDFTNLQNQITEVTQNNNEQNTRIEALTAQIEELKNSVLVDVPVGSMLQFSGTDIPSTYIACTGEQIEKAKYPDLYGVIGDRFKQSGDDADKFRTASVTGWIIKCKKA